MLFPEIKSTVKSEHEELTLFGSPIGYKMLDFWRWGMSNILSNTERGMLAEFIVATAVGFDAPIRNDWNEYDLTADAGQIKIEVKSAAYIQSWEQRNISSIRFSIKKSGCWNSNTNTYSEAKRHSDLYVFCLLNHKEQETLDPLKLEQWEFYVLETDILNKNCKNQNSISLSALQKLADAISYNQLRNKILEYKQ